MIVKCRICGGNTEVPDGSSDYICAYCGKKREVPSREEEAEIPLFSNENPFQTGPVFGGTASLLTPAAAALPTAESLLKRAVLFLEDKKWDEAKEYADKVLDIQAENWQAYLVLLMADVKVNRQEELQQFAQQVEQNDSFRKILRFGNEKIRREMNRIIEWNRKTEAEFREDEQRAEELEGRLRRNHEELKPVLAEIEKAKSNHEKAGKDLENIGIELNYHRAELQNAPAIFDNGARFQIEERIRFLEKEFSRVQEYLEKNEQTVSFLEKQRDEKLDRELVYRLAGICRRTGQFGKAYQYYSEIPGYRDVDRILRTDHDLAAAAAAAEVRKAKLAPFRTVGNVVFFGNYRQDRNAAGNPEAIEWLVVDVRDGKSLLLSRYALDAKAYNKEFKNVTWETCTLRSWLNEAFLETAFSEKERSAVLLTEVDNSAAQGFRNWNTDGGNNTQDKIFLLSFAEASRYLGVLCDNRINLNAQAWPTAYALKKGAYTVSGNLPAVWWWLRSPGYGGYNAATVNNAGSLGNLNVSYDHSCVRPAFWLDLDADIF